jgi:sugar phosphate isomerase/epimerase
MDLKLACADFTFPLLSFEKTLDLLVMLELPAVDIGLFEGVQHLTPSGELRNVERSAAKLKNALEMRGLRLADMFVVAALDRESLAPNNPDPGELRKSREILDRALEYTKLAGGSHLTQLPGVPFASESAEDSFKRASDELAWRVERANEYGVVYSVEAHLESIIETPEQVIRMVESTPNLTLSLDYTHFTKAGYSDAEIESLLQYASHFHVRGARKERLQAPFSENTIDYGRVLNVMNDQNYSGYQALEYVWIEWEHCNESDNLSETILFRDFLKNFAKEI